MGTLNNTLVDISRKPLTQESLKQLLHYNEDTGEFYWKGLINPNCDITKPAGTISVYNRRVITINNNMYYASKLAYLYMQGFLPDEEVDHKDTNTLNDSWLNLRLASKSENQHNKGIQKNNTSGFKGVYFNKRTNKWWGQVKLHGKYYSAGTFVTIEEAAQAVRKLRTTLHGEFANHG